MRHRARGDHECPRQVCATPCAHVARDVLSITVMREAVPPRFLELVVGRMLELVVNSVEGVRERLSRSRLPAH